MAAERSENKDFKLQSYWDDRFKAEEEYDWLVTFSDIQEYIIPLMPGLRDCKILVVGCGNSTFSADLYDYGYTNITNIDFSKVCIDNMRMKHENVRPSMTWLFMDMTELTFDDGEFDVVIDKASMDALMVDEGDVWDPEQSTIDTIDKTCLGIKRVLKPTGMFIEITFAQTHFRTKYLMAQRKLQFDCSSFQSLQGYCERYNWTLKYQEINPKHGCISYFIYSMQIGQIE